GGRRSRRGTPAPCARRRRSARRGPLSPKRWPSTRGSRFRHRLPVPGVCQACVGHFGTDRPGRGEKPNCRRLSLLAPMTLPFDSRETRDATTLEGVLERVVFSNEENAWSVVRLQVAGYRDLITAVGNLLGVQPGENLRLTGGWINDPKYGRQFRVSSYATVVPAT